VRNPWIHSHQSEGGGTQGHILTKEGGIDKNPNVS